MQAFPPRLDAEGQQTHLIKWHILHTHRHPKFFGGVGSRYGVRHAIFEHKRRFLRLTLQVLGHPQPVSPIHCDNITAAGIANGTAKKQKPQLMEKHYFFICNQVKNSVVDVRSTVKERDSCRSSATISLSLRVANLGARTSNFLYI